MLARSHRWFDRNPVAADALLAAAILTVALATFGADDASDGIAEGLLSVALLAPLAWRRQAPVPVFAVVMAACLVQLALTDHILVADFGVLVATYTLLGYGPSRRLGVLGVGVALVGAVLFALRWTDPLELGPVLGTIAAAGAHVLLAAVLGDRHRNRQAQVQALHEHNRLLVVERDQQATIAASAERARIARELHDIVAHSLSVIVSQADGGRYAAAKEPAAAVRALETIADSGRGALTEMRRLLGILRVEDAPEGAAPSEPAYAPQPGAAELEQLVREVGQTGLPVELAVEGDRRPLPGGVDVTVYRVVQEALTNVLRHADSPDRVKVLLRYVDDGVELAVRDDGSGVAAGRDGRAHGVLGMRERVELHGGALIAGPRSNGGYEVDAHLPTAPLPAGAGR